MIEKINNMNELYLKLQPYLDYQLLGNPLQTWINALLILLVFIILRFQLIKLFLGTVKTFTQKTKTTLDDKIVEVIEHPLRIVIVVFGLYLAMSTFVLPQTGELFFTNLFKSFIIIISSWILLRALRIFHTGFLNFAKRFHSELGESLSKLMLSIIRGLVIVLTLATLFNEWGFNVSAFVASLGLVGMALALAAKDTASNLFGSLVIFTDRPFKIGDWVKTPDVEGTIEDIGIRSTKVRTFAQALVSVPNGNLANSAILNWSEMEKRRIKMTLGLTYGTTSSQMQNILNEFRELLANDKDIHKQTIHVYFTDFQDSALGIFCYFFTNTTNWGEYMLVRERINLELMKIVEDNGAGFAFPSQSLYLENIPENLHKELN